MIADRFAPVLRELQPLSDRFAAAGHRLFLVGGTVRDLMLPGGDGVEPWDPSFDIDATTTARPDEIKRCLQGWADAIWTQGERFGTIGAMKRVPSQRRGATTDDTIERIYEITTHRAEAYHGHSRKPDVEFSFDIEADLSRRDFTVNAMAIELTPTVASGEPVLVDPFGGLRDLDSHVLRTPLEPEASFSDDPLRMLRAARFVARYGLQPEPSLLRAVRAMGDRLQIVSAERIRDELDKLLAAALPGDGLRFVTSTGLLQHVVPELAAATSQADETCHEHLWAHTVALVDAVPPTDASSAEPSFERRIVRLAALFRPLAGRRAQARMQSLRYSNDDVADVVALIHLAQPLLAILANDESEVWSVSPEITQLQPHQHAWSDAAVRRYVRDTGRLRTALHVLVRAEVAVHAQPLAGVLAHGLDVLETDIAALGDREPLDDLGPQLDGAQVMAVLEVEPGRVVGQALAHLAEVRLDEGLLSDDQIRGRLIEWWSHHQEQ